LAPPTQSLRDAAENDDWSTINTALRLFGPGLELADDDLMGADDVPPRVKALAADPADIPEEMRDEMPEQILKRLGD
jgi:glutamyl-tRNA reductase